MENPSPALNSKQKRVSQESKVKGHLALRDTAQRSTAALRQNVARNPSCSLRASAPSDGWPYRALASLST